MRNSAITSIADASSLSWTDALLTGHERIDADHRHIFDIAHRLEAELLAPPEHSVVGEVLVELIEYTGEHFLREEAVMRSIRFARYDEHKREHDLLVQKVNALHRNFMDGNGDSPGEVLDFLRMWLTHHILHLDMELVRGVKAAGAPEETASAQDD